MNNSFFSNFTPREPKFYSYLRDMAEVSMEASQLIVECVKNVDHETATNYAKQIKVFEKKGDHTLTHIFEELNTSFITPFDREDIHNLANRLDDVMDYINSGAKRIMLYRPKRMPESAETLAILIREASTIILKTVDELAVVKKNSKNIKQYCSSLHEIENSADEVYEEFISDLFANEKDSIEIIKLKDIMHEFEKATDAAEDVAKIIETIIVKYA